MVPSRSAGIARARLPTPQQESHRDVQHQPLHTRPLANAVRLGLATTAAVALTGLAGCATDDMSDMPGMNGSSSSATVAPTSTASAPSPSGTPANGPHNDADIQFASMMIPHHQQAIQMSDIILAKDGIDPRAIDLATRIKAAQAPEITRMSGWLAGWGANPSPSASGMAGMDHGDGTMSQAEMDELEAADATEGAKLFLTGMVKHHSGAISMAQQELTEGQNPEARELAQAIITGQQAEIEEMTTLLGQR